MSEKGKIYAQSDMLKACCKAENWDYDKALESFEYFYQTNRNDLKGGLKKAIVTWYNSRKEGKAL